MKNRPPLRYHGGKWMLAPWIISHFPPHRTYVEPFGGGASVLLRKPRCYAEIYNDIDGEIVNFFRVLQSPVTAGRLVELLSLTPFARCEFELAYEVSDDPVEQARRLVIRSLMGFGSDGHNGARPTGFRSNSNRSGTTPAHNWVSYPGALSATIKRLVGICIENRHWKLVVDAHDSEQTLHYLDPPYVHETRSTPNNSARKNYRHEMSNTQHEELLAHICGLKGMVFISGYSHPIYESALGHWHRVERKALADGARARVEVLWINPLAAQSIPSPDLLEACA